MVIKNQLDRLGPLWVRIKSYFSNSRKRSLVLTIFGLLVSLNVIVFAVLFTVKPKSVEKTKAANIEPLNTKVIVLKYFPLDSSRTRLDQDITGFNIELSRIRNVVSSAATHTAEKLTEASRYHGYKDPSAIPFLNYTAIETKEYLNAIPVSNIPAWGKSGVYRPDYRKILEDINICDYVDNKGVSEVWMWGYHHGNIEPDESNMRMGTASRNFWNYSTYGDISNSERWVDDHMPICNKTYVLYNYAYGYEENLGNVIEDHTHQIESVMNELQEYSSLLWSKYPGPGYAQSFYRCGWTHYPPNMMKYQGDGNSQHEYIWNSERLALSDCEDWTPEATGTKKLVSCHTWYGTTCLDDGGVGFKVWWMQNLPGYNNGLTYQGRQLRNWWEFIGAFDEAMAKGKSLLEPTPTPTKAPTIAPTPTRTPTPKPSTYQKVMLIVFNPTLEAKGGKKLVQERNWNDPAKLVATYASDLKSVSNSFVNYQIVSSQEIDDIPEKEDGFHYSDETYLDCWEKRSPCHSLDTANYLKILSDFKVCEKINSGQIDELWIFGGPYFGFYESRLAGPGAFFYNSPPLEGTSCQKQLPIMGFNYERGVPEMIENMGHRTESVLHKVFGGGTPSESNPWGRFTVRDIDSPGHAGCGNVHFGPNGTSDYDWSNQRTVLSNCNDWLNYPNLTGKTESINCQAWDCNGYSFLKWWFRHLPRAEGKTDGKQNNWWKYVLDYEKATTDTTPTPTATSTPKPTPTLTPKPTPTKTATPKPTPMPTPISKLTVYVYASGSSNDGQYPTMELKFEGSTICQWKNVKNYNEYTCTIKKVKSTSDLRIALINASSASNVKRVLVVDKLVLNRKTFETESPTTYTFKTRPLQPWCQNQDGYLKTESLGCNGYFKYNLSSL